MHPFEIELSTPTEDIELHFNNYPPLAWADFLLNPRRLRCSDFLMRWSQGVWSEERLTAAVNTTNDYYALPYSPSGTAPDDDPRAHELYFERLEAAGLGSIKRPDLLIFSIANRLRVEQIVADIGGAGELPFVTEDNVHMRELLARAVVAVECENSLWRAQRMPKYGATLTPQRRLGGKLGLKKVAVLPTVIVKDQDREPLLTWQRQTGVKIHIWHVFYDIAFGLSLDRAEELIASGLIEPTVQTFQAPGGATAKKAIYKFYYQYAYPLGHSATEAELVPAYIEDKNGHILPYVKFVGGNLVIAEEALAVLGNLARSESNER